MTLRWFLALGLLVGCDNGGDTPAGDDGEQPTTSAEDDDDGEDEDEDEAEDDTAEASTEDSGSTSDGEDSTTGGGEDAESSTGTTGDTQADEPTFDDVYQAVIAGRGCDGPTCHGEGDGGLWLDDADSSYDALVGAPALDGACGLTTLVVPGDPTTSALWLRLDPAAAPGAGCYKMPLNAPPLSPAEAELVRAWIEAGALR